MRLAPILMLCIAAPVLTACDGWRGFGAGAQIIAPDASLTVPCARPEAFLTAGDWEVIAGRIGDALIECGEDKAALVNRDVALRAAMKKGAAQ